MYGYYHITTVISLFPYLLEPGTFYVLKSLSNVSTSLYLEILTILPNRILHFLSSTTTSLRLGYNKGLLYYI